MNPGLEDLTAREKETLRLLLSGYDAKSIARHFNLSVHTINERLRDARRKLRVSSSREAARALAEAEGTSPNFLADKRIGVGDGFGRTMMRPRIGTAGGQALAAGGQALAWLGGGMLVMSLIVIAIAFSGVFQGSGASPVPASAPVLAQQASEVKAAREWALLVDRGRWEESWAAAGTLFKSQISQANWASTIKMVRQPLGPASSRTVQSATRTTTLPGAPAGDYEIIQFQTNFANRLGAVETIVLAREGSGWKVDGYFIR
nr:DUF4019 domain-containing protein [Sphingomonas sp.]